MAVLGQLRSVTEGAFDVLVVGGQGINSKLLVRHIGSAAAPQYAAASIIRRAAVLDHSHTRRLKPAATDACAAIRGN